MAIRPDVAIVLTGMGFDPILDFDASRADSGEIRLNWRSIRPRPTDAEIDAAAPAILAAIEAEKQDAAQWEAEKAAFRSALGTASNRLTAIKDAASFTNAQRDQATRDLAAIQLQTLKAIRRLIT